MADYFEQTVVQQTIPDIDITPLERLLLCRIFNSEPDGDGWYFFAEQGPCTMISASREELEQALTASRDMGSAAHVYVTEQLAVAGADASEIDLDLSGTSWEFFFQDIVKRSKTLAYISVVATFTCSKMRADGFGGMAVLITPNAILGKSTNDLLEDFLAETGLDDSAAAGAEPSDATPPDHGSEREAGRDAGEPGGWRRARRRAYPPSAPGVPRMTEYIVKIGFWLRAYDGFTVEADSDADAIEKAKLAAKTAMESTAHPEHIDIEERREGIIAFIDRITPDGRDAVIEDVEFDDDRIHDAPAA